nr:MAG TPA: hypothetical protein [Caudoviricetes sp.]
MQGSFNLYHTTRADYFVFKSTNLYKLVDFFFIKSLDNFIISE